MLSTSRQIPRPKLPAKEVVEKSYRSVYRAMNTYHHKNANGFSALLKKTKENYLHFLYLLSQPDLNESIIQHYSEKLVFAINLFKKNNIFDNNSNLTIVNFVLNDIQQGGVAVQCDVGIDDLIHSCRELNKQYEKTNKEIGDQLEITIGKDACERYTIEATDPDYDSKLLEIKDEIMAEKGTYYKELIDEASQYKLYNQPEEAIQKFQQACEVWEDVAREEKADIDYMEHGSFVLEAIDFCHTIKNYDLGIKLAYYAIGLFTDKKIQHLSKDKLDNTYYKLFLLFVAKAEILDRVEAYVYRKKALDIEMIIPNKFKDENNAAKLCKVLITQGIFLNSENKPFLSIPLFNRAAEIHPKTWTLTRNWTLNLSIMQIADQYYQQKNYDEALRLNQIVINGFIQEFESYRGNLSMAYSRCGLICHEQKRYLEAINYSMKAKEILINMNIYSRRCDEDKTISKAQQAYTKKMTSPLVAKHDELRMRWASNKARAEFKLAQACFKKRNAKSIISHCETALSAMKKIPQARQDQEFLLSVQKCLLGNLKFSLNYDTFKQTGDNLLVYFDKAIALFNELSPTAKIEWGKRYILDIQQTIAVRFNEKIEAYFAWGEFARAGGICENLIYTRSHMPEGYQPYSEKAKLACDRQNLARLEYHEGRQYQNEGRSILYEDRYEAALKSLAKIPVAFVTNSVRKDIKTIQDNLQVSSGYLGFSWFPGLIEYDNTTASVFTMGRYSLFANQEIDDSYHELSGTDSPSLGCSIM